MEGDKQMNSGPRMGAARTNSATIAAMNPSLRQSPTVHHILAQATTLHNAGRLLEAEAMIRHILTFDPNQPDALNLKGSIALRNGHPEAAVGVLTQAVAVAPRAADHRINLGHALKAMGRMAEAIASYREAVRLSVRPEGFRVFRVGYR
jgi:Flp pilus assembly protein TadD